jgi:hypothetical protein
MAINVTKPTVGGNEDTWGTTINTALDTIVDGVNGTSGTVAPNLSTLTINSTNVTATAAELNLLDGATAATATTVAGTDRVVLNDSGTMKQVAMTDIETYVSSQGTTVNNSTITFSAGNDLSGGGAIDLNQSSNETITISHGNTSSLNGATSNTGSNYIQNITVDDNGHVTAISATDASAALSGIGLKDASASDIKNNNTAQTISAGTYYLFAGGQSGNLSVVMTAFPTTNVEAGWLKFVTLSANSNQSMPRAKLYTWNGSAWKDAFGVSKTTDQTGGGTQVAGYLEGYIKVSGNCTITTNSVPKLQTVKLN